MKLFRLSRSLRFKLVAASVLVELVMLSLLVTNSVRLIETTSTDLTRLRLVEVERLLNSALAAPLVQRDLASLQEILDSSRSEDGFTYFVLYDFANRPIVWSGWEIDAEVPQDELDLQFGNDRNPERFDGSMDVHMGGQIYGQLRYGVSTKLIARAKAHLLSDSLIIAGLELLLSVVILVVLGAWLTRHLAELTRASNQMASGNVDIKLQIKSNDEVGDLTRTFNSMAQAIRLRQDEQASLLKSSRDESARLSALLQSLIRGILFENNDGRVIYANTAFFEIWAIDPATKLNGLATNEVATRIHYELARPTIDGTNILHDVDGAQNSQELEFALADGRSVTQEVRPINDERGQPLGRLWIFEDVTQERENAAQMVYLAERDFLTGLFNRRRFQEEIIHALDVALRRNISGALIYFDLDEFKYINDTFGHRAGDAMLIRVATEVGALTRHSEILSRMGGDEFAILLPDSTQQDAEVLAERILRAIAQIPFQFEGRTFRLTSSIGIAMYPTHAADVDELIAHADAAMYLAKESGKNAWRVYRQELDSSREMMERMSWNMRIANALEKEFFKLHYQGIYNAQNGCLEHVEVLVRLLDDEDPSKLIMPGRFIAQAEKTGQILNIDRWVIRNSIAVLAQQNQFPNVPISVNISGRSFDDPSLPLFIAEQLKYYGVKPQRFIVELTETAAVSDLHDAQHFISLLQRTGCLVCLDDFGAGFSSFTYLKHLKADILKIDGQFIRDLPNDYENQIFVKSIVDVARGLRKRTIAEFVEDAKTLEMLRGFGVDMVQGYHLHVPNEVPPDEIDNVIRLRPEMKTEMK